MSNFLRRRSRELPAGLACPLALLFLAGSACAQTVGSRGTWQGTGAPVPAGSYFTGLPNNSGNISAYNNGIFAIPAAGRESVQLRQNVTATQNLDATPDSFNSGFFSFQTFTLTERSVVYLPVWINGAYRYNQTGDQTGGLNVVANIRDSGAGLPILATNSFNYTRSGPGEAAQLFVDRFTFAQITLDPGTYVSQVAMTATGNATGTISPANPNGTTANGANVQSLMGTADRDGAAASTAFRPVVVGDSRDAVQVPQARNNWGVTGRNIRVGVTEPGSVLVTNFGEHDAINGRISRIAGPTAGDHNSEHALAVASIIAGQGPDDATSGVAPDARIVSTASRSYAGPQEAIQALIDDGLNIINRSAGGGAITRQWLDDKINNNNLTFVMAAGNDGGAAGGGATLSPETPANGIVVGSVDRSFNKRSSFSSFSDGGNPIKPDIVAPGEYIRSAVPADLDNNGRPTNDFESVFTGRDFTSTAGTDTGAISGTSFAAPIVSGAAALLWEYGNNKGLNAEARDHRVLKALLLNGADTAGLKRLDNSAWRQAKLGTLGGVTPLTVNVALDPDLGAGKLNADKSLYNLNGEQARDTNNNANFHEHIASLRPAAGDTGPDYWWDQEQTQGAGSTVDYLLGQLTSLRATLTWDRVGANAPANMQLRLFLEGADQGNLPGYDGNNAGADKLLAETNVAAGNTVSLLEFSLADYLGFALFQSQFGDPTLLTRNMYLQVVNYDAADPVQYGLAVIQTSVAVPTPAGFSMLSLAGIAAARRRRV